MSATANILNPLSWLRLWRHSGGYGVHSPFAYNFITDVLRQEHAYYCYGRLADTTLRTIFRIAVHLQPRQVEVIGEKAIGSAVQLAGSHIRVGKVPKPELMIVQGKAATKAVVTQKLSQGCAVIVLGKDTEFGRPRENCMSFSNIFANALAPSEPMTIMIPRADFSPQHFDILF